jgi:CDP-diglyceride synthetase
MNKNNLHGLLLGIILIVLGSILIIAMIFVSSSEDIYGRILITFLGIGGVLFGYGIAYNTKSEIIETMTFIGFWTMFCVVFMLFVLINLQGIGFYIGTGSILFIWFLLIFMAIRFRKKKGKNKP